MTEHLPDPSRSLDGLLTALRLPAYAAQCFDPAHPWFDAQRPLIVLAPQFEAARTVIADRYPSGHRLRVVHAPTSPTGAAPATKPEVEVEVGAQTIDDLAASATAPEAAIAWCLDPLAAAEDERGLSGLRAVIDRLVSPDGCPWDREQTPETLRKYLLEETYEAVEAIDRGDPQALREELGDILMHLLMQAALAETRGDFRLEDMVQGITQKMVRRHPHVFGDEQVESAEGLLDRWEELKAQERTAGDDTAAAADPDPAGLGSVPTALPALQRAQSLLGRAQRLDAAAVVIPDSQTLTPQLTALIATPQAAALGEFLLTIAAWAAAQDLDAEEALRLRGTAFVETVRAITPASRDRAAGR